MTLLLFLWMGLGSLASQAPAASNIWQGWARCQLNISGPGYADQQIHTWTLTGGAPVVEGAFRIHAATWSVVGNGSLQRTQGNQTLVAQWVTNVPAMSAPIAVFVRASDGRMFVQARHAQLRATSAVTGYQQQTIDGRPQPPVRISAEAFEWQFPIVDGATTATALSGSSAPAVNGSVGFMQPGGSRGTASCSWQFGTGGTAPAPPAAAATPPPTMTAVPLPPAVLQIPTTPVQPPAPTMTVVPFIPSTTTAATPTPQPPAPGEAAANTRPLAAPVATDPAEPNDSENEATPLPDLKMGTPALVVHGMFDVHSDTDDWFRIRIVDDGSLPNTNVLLHRDHHLIVNFVNAPYQIGDYPLYVLKVRATTGFLVTRDSETKMSPEVTVPWSKTAEDDSKTFVILIKRISGQPSTGAYTLVLQAD